MAGERRAIEADDDGYLYARLEGRWAAFAPKPLTVETKPVTSAQLLTLHSSPIELVPAPGAGFMVAMFEAIAVHLFDTQAYGNRLFPDFYYGDPNAGVRCGVNVGISAAFGSSANQITQQGPSLQNSDLVLVENQPLNFADLQDWTGGQGSGIIIIAYAVVPVR
jgi:hypothetical protein